LVGPGPPGPGWPGVDESGCACGQFADASPLPSPFELDPSVVVEASEPVDVEDPLPQPARAITLK
jgi:hypothetical protein